MFLIDAPHQVVRGGADLVGLLYAHMKHLFTKLVITNLKDLYTVVITVTHTNHP